MSDDNVIDLPSDFLPEAVRREMARKKREDAARPDLKDGPEPAETEPQPLPSLDQLSPLPLPGDPYKAHSRPASHAVLTLMVLTGDGKRWALPYAARVEGPHMLPGEPGHGDSVLMRFSLSVLVQLTLSGHDFDELHNYLADHRIRWVREVPKGRIVKTGGQPVITHVKIERVTDWPPPGMG